MTGLRSRRYFEGRPGEQLEVVYPEKGGHARRWKRSVYSATFVERWKERRKGMKDGGHWVEDGYVWEDGDGVWYSSKFLARETGIPHVRISDVYRQSDKIKRFKTVPPPPHPDGRPGGSEVVVHHWSEVHPLLGIGGPATSATQAGGAGKPPAGMPKKRGPKLRPESEALGAYLYRRWMADENLCLIRYGVRKEMGSKFGRDVGEKLGHVWENIREDSHVIEYAKRYARQFGKPLKPR